jgi:predicted small metal-binding protein
MRTVFCSCGIRLLAPDDEELFSVYRKHFDEAHPEMHITDETIHGVIDGSAHDDFKEHQVAHPKDKGYEPF